MKSGKFAALRLAVRPPSAWSRRSTPTAPFGPEREPAARPAECGLVEAAVEREPPAGAAERGPAAAVAEREHAAAAVEREPVVAAASGVEQSVVGAVSVVAAGLDPAAVVLAGCGFWG